VFSTWFLNERRDPIGKRKRTSVATLASSRELPRAADPATQTPSPANFAGRADSDCGAASAGVMHH
jgi:hypothetical protein